MSQSLDIEIMTKLFKIQGYKAKSIEIEDKTGDIQISLEKVSRSNCKSCLFPHQRYDSSLQKILIGVVLGKPVYALLKVYRIQCPVCGILTEPQTISEGKKRYSKAIGFDIIRYSRYLDTQSLSKLFGLSQSTIYRIDRSVLEQLLTEYRKKLVAPNVISIDEVSHKRRHKYATVITAYEEAKVLWLENGRKGIDLKRGYHQFKGGVTHIKTVAMDFWKPYYNTTEEKISKAKIVFDRFHLSRILNRKIEEERRSYQKKLSDKDRKHVKKHTRWVILKRKNRLTQKNKEYLEQLRKDNEPLYNLYLLKEDFLEIFDPKKSRKQAKDAIIKWKEVVSVTKYNKLKQFAKTVIQKMDTILNWFDEPISNAKSEGINNIIKTLLKRSYGFRDFEYFRMKVLQKCGNLMTFYPGEI